MIVQFGILTDTNRLGIVTYTASPPVYEVMISEVLHKVIDQRKPPGYLYQCYNNYQTNLIKRVGFLELQAAKFSRKIGVWEPLEKTSCDMIVKGLDSTSSSYIVILRGKSNVLLSNPTLIETSENYISSGILHLFGEITSKQMSKNRIILPSYKTNEIPDNLSYSNLEGMI